MAGQARHRCGGLPGMTVKQDGEQGGRDGDAAAHQGDVGERRQQLRRDGGLGQLLWEESVAGGWMHSNGPHPGSVRDVPDLSSMLPSPQSAPRSWLEKSCHRHSGFSPALNSSLPLLVRTSPPSPSRQTHHSSLCVDRCTRPGLSELSLLLSGAIGQGMCM